MNNEGYWYSLYAKLQPEDVMDCLTIIYPEFDFSFLDDQSSGHTKMRDDSLLYSNMNISYGGAVSNMYDTISSESGQYTPTLDVGAEQSMVFCKTDDGPF